MKSIISQGFIAMSAAAMVFAATSSASATGSSTTPSTPLPSTPTPSAPLPPVVDGDDWTMPFACGAGSAGGLLGSLRNVVTKTLQIQALNQVNVENICLVNVHDVLNGNVLNLLNYSTLLVNNLVNVGVLQNVLSNIDVIDSFGNVLNFNDFIDIGNIVITDIVSTDLDNYGTMFVFYE